MARLDRACPADHYQKAGPIASAMGRPAFMEEAAQMYKAEILCYDAVRLQVRSLP
jgi:hypothetical protein